MGKQLKERVQVGIDDYGKPIYKWATGFTKQELMLSAARLLLESEYMKDGGQSTAKKHRFRDYAQHWFDVFKKPTVRPLTAKQQRMANSWSEAGAFKTIQDALQFYPKDDDLRMIGSDN